MKYSEVELSASVNWARYWILKAVQHRLATPDLHEQVLQTCPMTLLVSDEPTSTDHRMKIVRAKGRCLDRGFSATCTLWRYGGSEEPWSITSIYVGLDGGEEEILFHYGLPDYPQTTGGERIREKVIAA